MIDVVDNGYGGFAGSIALLGVDEVRYLEAQGQVGLKVLRIAGILNVSLQRRRGRFAREGEPIPGDVSSRCSLQVGQPGLSVD